jgi:hypothetical protein
LIDEIQRIRFGPRAKEIPSGVGTIRFVIDCPTGSTGVLERVRGLMIDVAIHSAEPWPDTIEWSALLPNWFVAASPPDRTDKEVEAYISEWRKMNPEQQSRTEENRDWPIADWLFWMEPEQRCWHWWDAADMPDSNRILLDVDVESWPFPWGALRWMFKAAGASATHADFGD